MLQEDDLLYALVTKSSPSCRDEELRPTTPRTPPYLPESPRETEQSTRARSNLFDASTTKPDILWATRGR